ncbi:MAG: phosphodiester glycosidase family protein [Defluviitaleaceae bacterium]|nr:phosphodiester glycosidase family protein [Defluviitaleaceae bacterium]
MKNKKNIKKYMISIIFLFTFKTYVYGNIIHIHNIGFDIASGISYEQSRRITRAGLVDVHILTVDLTNENITMGPALPPHGSRDTTSNLLQNNGAVAGINADFFNVNVYPSTSLGQVIQNGDLLEITRSEGYAASFIIDINNNAMIQYIQPEIVFLNNGIRNLNLQDINKVNGNIIATVFDNSAIFNTVGIDARQSGLVKIVVEDGYITYISYPGENIDVPSNGYIIALSESYAYHFTESILVGHSAELVVSANVDIDNIWNAISGGGSILQNGEVVEDGFVVSGNARHPRSAVGINQNGTKVFLVTVDGRNHSIGATHSEMAEILRDLGAFNAMHLDGGGSSTMAIRSPGESDVRVMNAVSEGSERRIVNALGIFNNAPVGVLTDIDIRSRDRVFVMDSINFYPIGLDDHLNPINLSFENVQINTWPLVPREGNVLFPNTIGSIDISLMYGEHQKIRTIEVMELSYIEPNIRSLNLNTGDLATVNFVGISPRGHREIINSPQVNIIPEEAGTLMNGVFTAGEVSGVIRISLGAVFTDIVVNVNNQGFTSLPTNILQINPYRDILDTHGNGFDITIVGNTSINQFMEFENISDFVFERNNALRTFISGSNLGIFVGSTEVEEIENFETIHHTAGYSFRIINNNTAIINLDAQTGSLTGTSVYNWSFVNEVNNIDIDNVIILINRDINNLPAYEVQMIKHALEELGLTKNVFVIWSWSELETKNVIENGVTYIALSGLFYHEYITENVRVDSEDNEETETDYISVSRRVYSLNPNFNILRFRILGTDIRFDFH